MKLSEHLNTRLRQLKSRESSISAYLQSPKSFLGEKQYTTQDLEEVKNDIIEINTIHDFKAY